MPFSEPREYICIDKEHNNEDTEILCVKTRKESNYTIHVSYGHLKEIAVILKRWLTKRKTIIVTTPTVNFLYGRALANILHSAGIQVTLKVLNCSEASKSLSQAERICRWAQKTDLGRGGLLVSFGGGVCMDIVSVAASLIYRGIQCIRVPTTLIGLVDAGIGIKGAVNFGNAKNYLGCFSPPLKVLIAPFLLRTLSNVHLKEGFAEILKMAIIRDATLLQLIENHGALLIEDNFKYVSGSAKEILLRSIIRMIEELEPNIYENQSYERLVDFGHTFSPLLEIETRYQLSHGRAVAIDIALSTALSYEMGLISHVYCGRILDLIRSLDLPIYVRELTPSLCQRALQKAVAYRGGHPNLVLPTEDRTPYFLKDAEIINDTLIKNGIRILSGEN